MRIPAQAFRLSLFAAASLAVANTANATLALTAAGVADGFTLSTFVTGTSNGYGNYEFVSLAIAPNGKVLAQNSADSKIYIFNDADGQSVGSELSSVPYTVPSGTGLVLTTAGGQDYGVFAQGGRFVNVSGVGVVGATIGPPSLTGFYGLWGNPVNGHIIATTNTLGLVDLDPTTGLFTTIEPNGHYDGVTVTPDGLTAYVADFMTDSIKGFDIGTGNLVFNSGDLLGPGTLVGPDGMGVIGGTCSLAGSIIVDNNDGTVALVNPSSNSYSVIANGGSRGDFASIDTNNGSLFLSQDEQIARLTIGNGCSIGANLPTVPEPATPALLVAGLAGALLGRKKKAGRAG